MSFATGNQDRHHLHRFVSCIHIRWCPTEDIESRHCFRSMSQEFPNSFLLSRVSLFLSPETMQTSPPCRSDRFACTRLQPWSAQGLLRYACRSLSKLPMSVRDLKPRHASRPKNTTHVEGTSFGLGTRTFLFFVFLSFFVFLFFCFFVFCFLFFCFLVFLQFFRSWSGHQSPIDLKERASYSD